MTTGPRPRRLKDTGHTQTREWQQLLATYDGATLPCAAGRAIEWVSPDPAEQARAARLCAACHIQTACLNYALATKENYGVYGGKTSAERKAILRKRRRASRKTAA